MIVQAPPITRIGRRVVVVLLGVSLATSAGCASMHHGRTQHVIVTSDPPGARIFANDRHSNLLPHALPIALRTPRGATRALIAVCVLSSACATAINGTTQRVAVASDPPGAQVYVNDAPVGVTPAFVDVPRRDRDLELRFEKDGYEPARLALERGFSGWSWGNVLLAGVPINDYGTGQWVGAMVVYGALGWLRDVRSGGAYKRPSLVRATLDPVRPARAEIVEGSGESPHRVRVPGSPIEFRPRNHLVPLQLGERVHRLTGRRTAWDPDLDRNPRPVRP